MKFTDNAKFVVGLYPDKEVNHEEDVESEIDLLRCAVGPSLARLHCLTATAQYLL